MLRGSHCSPLQGIYEAGALVYALEVIQMWIAAVAAEKTVRRSIAKTDFLSLRDQGFGSKQPGGNKNGNGALPLSRWSGTQPYRYAHSPERQKQRGT